MRTTIDLPPDIHRLARQLAHDQNTTMSAVIEQLIRVGLGQDKVKIVKSRRGMPAVSVGRPITIEDVWELEDE